MPDTDDSFVSHTGGSPEPIVMPTVNASLNVWGILLNTGQNLVATTIKYIQGLITDIQTAATALTTRVTAVEAKSPAGFSNVMSGNFYFGATCEGFETETVVLSGSRVYAVPFDYVGTFSAVALGYLGTQAFTITVRDSGPDNLPGAILATASTPGTFVSGSVTVSLSVSVTLTRPAWITITGFAGQPYTRGTTGAPPARWVLGSSSATATPASASDLVTCVSSAGGAAPWTAVSLGTKGWAPSVALRAS